MLRRLNVRTRLAAVLLLPLVLFMAVGGPELLQRQEAARAADRAGDLAVASAEVTRLVDALQQERLLTSALRAGADEGLRTRLAAQRDHTDAAALSAERAFAFVSRVAPALTAAVEPARAELADLPLVREASDRAASIVPWNDPFGGMVSGLLDLNDALATRIDEPAVQDALAEVALLSRSKEAAAAQSAQLAAAVVWGELRGDQIGILSGLRADEQAFRAAHLAVAPAELQVARRSPFNAGSVIAAGRAVDSTIREGSPAAAGGLESWLTASRARQDTLRSAEVDRITEALNDASSAGSAARRASAIYVVLVGLGMLTAVVLAVAAARSIATPLRRLTEAADHLAEERLPQLVDALRHPGEDDERFLATTIQPIEVTSQDELGHLARSFNAVQAVAVDVAAEQAHLLRKGISDLFVNLARRNQSLLERQILLLDEVERHDQDPELLQHLYELDHLATRMRRNAESLLVLAGVEPDRRKARPAPTVDVLRAAVSEVEQYDRVELGSVATADVVGAAASDVSHIVAELLDNAARYSSPRTVVRVDGRRAGNGYQIVVADQGVGMPAAQLNELNHLLREPPVTGLALGRSLGCLVAARLAARHGISVWLQPGESGGLVATVTLPRHLVTVVAPAERPAEVTVPDAPPEPAFAPEPADDPWLHEWGDAAGPITIGSGPGDEPSAAPATLRDALPTAASFDAGLDALLHEAPRVRPTEPRVGPTSSGSAEVTASGLARRIPGASADVAPPPPPDPTARRSPDEVRSMLARYRAGLQAGRDNGNRAEE